MTLNVAGLGSDWFESRSEALAGGLATLAPDIVCLQEVTIRSDGGPYNQAEAIGREAGLPAVAFAPYGNPIESVAQERGGIAVVSRWPLVYAENRRLPEGKLSSPDNRVALLVGIAAPWGRIDVVTTHLSWQPGGEELRKAQIHVILDYVSALGLLAPGRRFVLAGDLNAVEDEGAIAEAAAVLLDCFRLRHDRHPGHTWSRANPLTRMMPEPDRRLDYIFCAPGARIRDARVVLDRAEPVFPSDHFGVYVDLEFPERG